EVAAVCRSIELPSSGDHEDVAVSIRGRTGIALPDCTIRRIGRRVEDRFLLDDWLNIQEYLVKVLRKFQGDIGGLQRAAADIVRPFHDEPGCEVFARWFRGARERGRVLRLVFSNDSGSKSALARLRLENLDRGILG